MRLVLIVAFLALSISCGSGNGPKIPDAQTAGAPSSGNSAPTTYDSTSDARLTTLPPSLRRQLLACEATTHFYDLGAQKCTDEAPAPFVCIINDDLRALLDPSTLSPLADYLINKAADLTLYSCTVDPVNVSLHFFKFEAGVVQYRKLNVAKKKD
ncbi:MAG: hypothetical protein H7249_09700 [Chitinophagaceae bacterium]|nr:hypothetical protein [Oligoflexus sp.]